jgi:hypothetical protein
VAGRNQEPTDVLAFGGGYSAVKHGSCTRLTQTRVTLEVGSYEVGSTRESRERCSSGNPA